MSSSFGLDGGALDGAIHALASGAGPLAWLEQLRCPMTATMPRTSTTATIAGQVTSTLLGNPPPPANPTWNDTEGSGVENCSDPPTPTCRKLAIYNGYRQDEALGPLELPSNWSSLTVPEQLFVLTELERTARCLPTETGLAADWDQNAQQGADAGDDSYLCDGLVSRPHPRCVRFTSSFGGCVGALGRADGLRAGAQPYFGPRSSGVWLRGR